MKQTVTSLKGKVRFAFKDSIKSLQEFPRKESLVFLHFSFGGDRLKYSTGYKSSYSNWNFEKQRIKNTKAGILNADEVNEYLGNLESFINKEFSKLIAEQSEINKDVLRKILDQYTNKNIKQEVKELTFLQFTEHFFSVKEKDIQAVTLRSYKQTVKLLNSFSIATKQRLDFQTFDKNFYNNFTGFLEKNSYKINTIAKHIKNLKSILNYALLEGVSVNERFKARDFKAKTEQTVAIYLDSTEIEKIHKKDLSNYGNLEIARDIFLIGCYTGQRVSDYNGLTCEDIVTIKDIRYFEIKQKKTQRTVHCPLTKEINEILSRYNGCPPKKVPEQKINEYIKDIGQMVGIDEKVYIMEIIEGKIVKKPISKYKLIGTHTARRSFCTNMYRKKMPVYDIMLFSGHTTEKEFYKYIRISKQDRATQIANSGFFNL
jgi:integrase